MNKRTVRTAQYDDQVMWHMPPGFGRGIPMFREERLTLPYT